MEYYDYSDWIALPVEEIRAYAQEIAEDEALTEHQARYLTEEMLIEAGHWRAVYPPSDKSKNDDAPDEWKFSFHYRRVGSGLTQKLELIIDQEGDKIAIERARALKEIEQAPFGNTIGEINEIATKALWRAGCYPIYPDDWLIWPGHEDAIFEGLVWYAIELRHEHEEARYNAREGNIEKSLLHAYNAGKLYAELAVRLQYAETFDKYDAVYQAQSDAARARKTVSDELRRDTYWRFRHAGNKRVESGELAAKELGLSEASIRNAFPGRRYPTE